MCVYFKIGRFPKRFVFFRIAGNIHVCKNEINKS